MSEIMMKGYLRCIERRLGVRYDQLRDRSFGGLGCVKVLNYAPYNHRRQTQICDLHKHNIHICGPCRGHYYNVLEGLTMAVSCGSRCPELVHHAPQSGRSAYPSGNPIVEWSKNVVIQESMVCLAVSGGLWEGR